MMTPPAISAVVPMSVCIRRALIPEFCSPVDFPAPRANPNVE
jgi:hypothetical protein